MSNSNANKKHQVQRLAEMMNKFYGARIPLKQNPLDENSPARTVPEICDDLYMVMDRNLRMLTDDAALVKESLRNAIENLQFQKNVLDEAFAKDINALRNSRNLNTVGDAVTRTVALGDAVRSEFQRQIAELQKQMVLYEYDLSQVMKDGAHFNVDITKTLNEPEAAVETTLAFGETVSKETECRACGVKLGKGIEFFKINNDERTQELRNKRKELLVEQHTLVAHHTTNAATDAVHNAAMACLDRLEDGYCNSVANAMAHTGGGCGDNPEHSARVVKSSENRTVQLMGGKRRRKSKRKSKKRKSKKRKSRKRKSKRKSRKRKSGKRKSAKRKSAKRKSKGRKRKSRR